MWHTWFARHVCRSPCWWGPWIGHRLPFCWVLLQWCSQMTWCHSRVAVWLAHWQAWRRQYGLSLLRFVQLPGLHLPHRRLPFCTPCWLCTVSQRILCNTQHDAQDDGDDAHLLGLIEHKKIPMLLIILDIRHKENPVSCRDTERERGGGGGGGGGGGCGKS